MVEKPSATIDSLLKPLLPPTSDEQADEFISQLIASHAEPVIKRVIRYKLHLSPDHPAQREDVDDIYQEVVVQLIAEFAQLRSQPDAHPITDVRGFSAVLAHRTCSRWLRRQFPERHALKNRIYYLLTRQRGFAMWRAGDQRLIAGFAAWQGREPTAQASNEQELVAQIGSLTNDAQGEVLADVLASLFNLAGPIEFDTLVRVLASLLKIRDQPFESTDLNEATIAVAAARREPSTEWRVEKRIFLERLWEELQKLPLNQRAALLLNLKDDDGRGCIALFSITGIASMRQLAAALEIIPDTFAELWNELPLEDSRIADLLHLTRQQVINARKSGRERLTRRLKGFI